MPYEQAKPAASAASVALMALCLCIGGFLPPLSETVLASLPLILALGIGIAASLALHLYFVGLAAAKLGRRPAAWVLLALVTLPIGSIVGLVIFEWYASQASSPSGAA